MRKLHQLNRDKVADIYGQVPWGKFWYIARKYRRLFLHTLLLMIIFNSLIMSLPWLLKLSIDRVMPNGDYFLFIILCCVIVGLFVIRCCLRRVVIYIIDFGGMRLICDLRIKIFRHVQRLSLSFFQRYRVGKLISNIGSDTQWVNSMFRASSAMFEALFQICLVSVILFTINWKMALVTMLFAPLHFLNFYFSSRKLRQDNMLVQEKSSEVSANLAETLTGAKVVKSFGTEQAENWSFFQNQRPLVALQMRQTADNFWLHSLFDILKVLTSLSTIGVAIVYVQNGTLSIGEFVAFYTYVNMIFGPIQSLANNMLAFSQGAVGITRIFNLLDREPEIVDPEGAIRPTALTGHIEFKHVNFAYDQNRPDTVHDFNLEIKPGEKVALVGSSGSGKSTISNLLLRFYDVTGGEILVDGVDIRKFSTYHYRKHIGVVLQDPFLFSGTIKSNIAYAKKDATFEEIEEAARIGNISDFINSLPHGYDTIIGENGASLSGGQKQRIAIARAALVDPAILILDEATSALDTISEQVVQTALDKLMEKKTTLIIAHRLSTIRNADKIIVIDKGQIKQVGTHDELLSEPGIYQDLYTNQRKLALQ